MSQWSFACEIGFPGGSARFCASVASLAFEPVSNDSIVDGIEMLDTAPPYVAASLREQFVGKPYSTLKTAFGWKGA